MKAKPKIERLVPSAAIAGGEIAIHGCGFTNSTGRFPRVELGGRTASLLVASDDFLLARVPEGTTDGWVRVHTGGGVTEPVPIGLAVLMADNLHPVANPAVDPQGNVYVTFSGSRGQKVPISVYRIEQDSVVKPFLSELVNPTGLALDSNGRLYISSRFDGVVYQVTPEGQKTTYAEGMGVATGIAFDGDENLYVGDRTGTIFKVGRDRQIFVFATLEPSVAAYHLAFGPDAHLYVTGPTTSSFDSVYRISDSGEVSIFYRGLGRPQGLAFDQEGNLYVAASTQGRRGIVRITPQGRAELAISGPHLVGLAFAPAAPGRGRLVLVTHNAAFELPWSVAGSPLLPGD
jgi:sugar lactone lactonase YvrE